MNVFRAKAGRLDVDEQFELSPEQRRDMQRLPDVLEELTELVFRETPTVSEQNGYCLERHALREPTNGGRIPQHVEMPLDLDPLKESTKGPLPVCDRCLGSPLPDQKKYRSLSFETCLSALRTVGGSGSQTGVPVFCVYRKSFPFLIRARSRVAASRMRSPEYRNNKIMALSRILLPSR